MPEITKRYFVIHTNGQTEFDYPTEFINSQNKKYVHVLNAQLYVEDIDNPNIFERPNYAFLHASFVQDMPYCDSMVVMCNDESGDRKKYQQFSKDRTFRVWLTDYAMNPLNFQDNVHLIVSLMLEY